MRGKHLISSIVAVTAALAVASAAAAGGEAKSAPPFTHSPAARTPAVQPTRDAFERYVASHPDLRSSATPDAFERYVASHAELGSSTSSDVIERYVASHRSAAAVATMDAPSGGFDWSTALIASTCAAAMLALVGATLGLARSRRRDRLAHAVGS
jgi:hypothetical protein